MVDLPNGLKRTFSFLDQLPGVIWMILPLAFFAGHLLGVLWFGFAVVMGLGLTDAINSVLKASRVNEDLFYYQFFLGVLLNIGGFWVLRNHAGGSIPRYAAVQWVGLMVISLLPYYLRVLAWLFALLNLSLYDPAPLSALIERAVPADVSVPTFATITDSVEYNDPDHVNYEAVHTLRGIVAYYRPLPHSSHYPRYIRVDHLDAEKRRELLLTSAALPPAVTPTRRIGTFVRLVDGGISDNLPWTPLVLDYPCDELVIVGCNPIASWDDEARRAECATYERLRRVLAAKHQLSSVDRGAIPQPINNQPPSVIGLKPLEHWPSRVILIAPQAPLGTFFSATINFDATRALALVRAGYEVGLSAVRTYGLS
jgi:hypothetical protein